MAADASPVKFNGVLGMAVRRWYVVVAGLVLVLPLSYLAAAHVEARYTMKASTVLLVPQKAVGNGGNPYLALGGLDAAVDVVAAGLSSDAIQEQVARTGATTGVVARDASTSAPILLVTVTAPSREEAAAGVATLLGAVPPTLQRIQRAAGVDSSQLIRSEIVASSKRPVVSHKPQIRAALMVLLAGAALTLLATAVVDALARRRRRRRAERALVEEVLRTDPVDEDDRRPATLDLVTARGRKR